MIVLQSLGTFEPGFHVNFRELAQGRNRLDWYQGNYRSLFPSVRLGDSEVYASQARRMNAVELATGEGLLEWEAIIKVPLFRMVSEFMFNATLGEMPTATGDTQAQETWLTENRLMLERALHRAITHWTIHDLAVFTAEPGLALGVDPLTYYRVGNPDQRDELVGHIIAYPYRVQDRETENTQAALLASRPQQLVPNRIKVTKITPGDGPNTEQHFRFDGQIVGQPITGISQSPITQVCVAGMGEPWYDGVRDVAARVMLDLSNIEQDQNFHRNRIEYVPSEVAAAIRDTITMDSMTPTATAVREALRGMLRPVVPISEEDFRMDEREAPEQTAAFEALRMNLDLFFMGASLPPSSFGIGIGRGESGFAREKAQDAATARVRTVREQVSECLPRLAYGAGCPSRGALTFGWTSPPFQDRAKHAEEVRLNLAAGIIDRNEARNELGLAPVEETEEPGQTEDRPQEESNG